MINLVIALSAEAAPLIQHWRLKKSNRAHPFPLFNNDDMQLVVCGIGKCNSAAATAWLAGIQSKQRQRNSIWLNIGIAGHISTEIGTAICASRILDSATKQNWYPTLINNTMQKSTVQTMDKPTPDYANDNALDMEASGFYQTAIRMSTTELTQCFKAISDNSDSPISNLTSETTKSLIGDNLPTFTQQIEILQSLSYCCEVTDSSAIELEFHRRWRFSTTQKHQLQRLLHRQLAISGNYNQAQLFLQKASATNFSSAELLNRLSSLTDQTTPPHG